MFDYSTLEKRFPITLSNKTTLTYPFDKEQLLADWISFYYFRILINKPSTRRMFPGLVTLFTYMESLLYRSRIESNEYEIKDYLFLLGLERTDYKFNDLKDKYEFCYPILQVIPLISLDGIYLKDGYILLNNQDLTTLLTALFYKQLLYDTTIDTDINLIDLPVDFTFMNKIILESFPRITKHKGVHLTEFRFLNETNCEELDKSIKYFPLCMFKIFRHMNMGQNIMYDSRHQIGVFMYHTGLQSNEWIKYLNKHIPQKMKDPTIPYYFRFLYGERGSRIIEPVWTCIQVSEPAVERNQYHGCPFDLTNKSVYQLEQELNYYLQEYSKYLLDIDKQEIVTESIKYSKENKPTKACFCLFEKLAHIKQYDIEDLDTIQFPNHYAYCLYNCYNLQ